MIMKVTISAAMTVDGKIATASGESAISSNDDLKRVHRMRAASDAVLIGIATALADDPQLTVRLARGKNPARVIVDSRGRLPADSRLLKTARNVRTMVAVTEKASSENTEMMRRAGAEVVIVPCKDPSSPAVDLEALFKILEKMGFKKVLAEGGGELNWSLLRLGLADRLVVTVAPRLVGGRLATTLVEGDGFDAVARGIRLKLARVQRVKKTGELVLYYDIIGPRRQRHHHSTF